MSSIKILVACHARSFVPVKACLYPIQVGSALADFRLDNMLHDDEGDHISDRNSSYGELTAHYWMWKNLPADFYGLFHYRRYFSFNPALLPSDPWGNTIYPRLDEAAMSELNLNEAAMRAVIEPCDILAPAAIDLRTKEFKSVRAQYVGAPDHYGRDLDLIGEIIKQKRPEFEPFWRQYLDSDQAYFCNMFIMRREYFDRYSALLFELLEEHRRQTDVSSYSRRAGRVGGYLGERIFGAWYLEQKIRGQAKTKEMQRSLFLASGEPAPYRRVPPLSTVIHRVFPQRSWRRNCLDRLIPEGSRRKRMLARLLGLI